MLEQFSLSFGVIILTGSIIMGGIIFFAPGSIRLQRPECGWVGWTFNIMNLLFFLLIIPISGVLKILDLELPLFAHVIPTTTLLHFILELAGIIIFLLGSFVLLWSRLSLRRSFRLAGVKPSSNDYLTLHGPYKLIRHPMYLSALLVLFGLTLILSSVAIGISFILMLLLIIKLIPKEEEQLDQAYPMAYAEYCRRVPGALFPQKNN